LVDNYVDNTVLTLLRKRNETVMVSIYTRTISKQLKLDIDKHNAQYTTIDIRLQNNVHDRFLIIDNTQMYHIGASLKDLGKKCFGFSRMDTGVLNFIANVKIADSKS